MQGGRFWNSISVCQYLAYALVYFKAIPFIQSNNSFIETWLKQWSYWDVRIATQQVVQDISPLGLACGASVNSSNFYHWALLALFVALVLHYAILYMIIVVYSGYYHVLFECPIVNNTPGTNTILHLFGTHCEHYSLYLSQKLRRYDDGEKKKQNLFLSLKSLVDWC